MSFGNPEKITTLQSGRVFGCHNYESHYIIEGLRSKRAIKQSDGKIDVFVLTYPRLIKEHAAAVLTYQKRYFQR